MSSCTCAQGGVAPYARCIPFTILNSYLLARVYTTCASTCVYYTCQHMCILHVLARVYTTRASTCVLYTCQHVCLLHVLDYYSKTCLLDHIKGVDFESLIFAKPVKEQADAISNILTTVFEKYVPVKTVVIRPTDPPWVNSYTRLLLRKKNRIKSMKMLIFMFLLNSLFNCIA